MIEAGSLWELVARRADATPDALFAVDDADRTLHFAAYRDAALRCAAGLSARGVGPGVAVSWQLPTTLESMVLAAALARLGAVQNPILPIYREREVGFVARQSQARLLVVPRRFRGFDYAGMAREVAAATPGLDVLALDVAESSGRADVGATLPAGDPAALPPPPEPTAPADAPVRWLFYTSGTTADPKGARHTDHTLMAEGRVLVSVLELAPDDRVALVFPLTHIGGVGWLCAGLLQGCAHIVVPVFDPEGTVEVLARHGVTQGTAGTVFHQAYLAAQRRRGGAPIFPRIRAFPGGGAPKPPQLHAALRDELGGVGVVSGYGLTECPVVVMNTVRDPDEKLAHTEGRPTPGMRVRIVTADGREAAPGEEGEIRVRGPQLCRGYVDAALDAEAYDAESFFRTGDLGRLDADGYLVVTGRVKDVIIRKGENVSAKEVEDLLHGHPRVAEVAVIGLPDAASGERVCAVVVPTDAGDPLRFDEMVAFLKEQRLMLQKIPEQLELVPALPRNPSGKILKRELRSRFGDGGESVR